MKDFSKRLVAYWVGGSEPEIMRTGKATMNVKSGEWNNTYKVKPGERAAFIEWLADEYDKHTWDGGNREPGETAANYLARVGVTVDELND